MAATIVTCPHCGKRNRVQATAQGVPQCANCGHKLPWLVDAVPYVCAVVELAEGPWLTVRLVDADPDTLAAGQPVRVRFVPSGPAEEPGEILPVFAPA